MKGADWIRLYTDFFDNSKIKQIRLHKKGDMIICVWIALMCLAGKQNRCGVFMVTDAIPYSLEGLASEIGRNPNDFKIAMENLLKYEMIINIDGVYAIKNWGVYQQQLDTLDRQREQNRERVAKYRERQKIIRNNLKNSAECNADVMRNVMRNVTDLKCVSNAPCNAPCNADVTPLEKSKSKSKSNIYNIASKQVSNLKKEEQTNSACVGEGAERFFKNESYNDILDSFGVNGEYRNAIFRFIKHLKANFDLILLNDRLEALIVRLDLTYRENSEKVKAIDEAISKGYKRLECEC